MTSVIADYVKVPDKEAPSKISNVEDDDIEAKR